MDLLKCEEHPSPSLSCSHPHPCPLCSGSLHPTAFRAPQPPWTCAGWEGRGSRSHSSKERWHSPNLELGSTQESMSWALRPVNNPLTELPALRTPSSPQPAELLGWLQPSPMGS